MQEKVKYCSQCGKELEYDSRFCAYCGSEQQVEGKTITRQYGKSKKIVLVILFFCCLVTGIVGVNIFAPDLYMWSYTNNILDKNWEKIYSCICPNNEFLELDDFSEFADLIMEDVTECEWKRSYRSGNRVGYEILLMNEKKEILLKETYEVEKQEKRKFLLFSDWKFNEEIWETEIVSSILELVNERAWKETYYDFCNVVYKYNHDWDEIYNRYEYIKEELVEFYNGNYHATEVLQATPLDSTEYLYFWIGHIDDDNIPELVLSGDYASMMLRFDEGKLKVVEWCEPDYDQQSVLFNTAWDEAGFVERQGKVMNFSYGSGEWHELQIFIYDGISMVKRRTIEFETNNGEVSDDIKEYRDMITHDTSYLWLLSKENIEEALKFDKDNVSVSFVDSEVELGNQIEHYDIGEVYRELFHNRYDGKLCIKDILDIRFDLIYKNEFAGPFVEGYYQNQKVWSENHETFIEYLGKLDGVTLFGLYPGMQESDVEHTLEEYGFYRESETDFEVIFYDGPEHSDTGVSVYITDGKVTGIGMWFVE